MRNFTPLSADELAAAFGRRLKRKRNDVARVASFWNSFEGWLKFELALELCERWRRRPWSNQSPQATWETIGVEHKVALPGKTTRAAAQARRQIDLWVCAAKKTTWHYVELKVVFRNANATKQIESWNSELEMLRSAEDGNIDGRVVLLVAVGFTKGEIGLAAGSGAKIVWIHHAVINDAHSTPSVALVSRVA